MSTDAATAVDTASSQQTVAYIYNKPYIAASDQFIPTTNRNAMVHSLIESCGFLGRMRLVAPKLASHDQLAAFHCRHFLDTLRSEDPNHEDAEEFGFGYDCPLEEGVYEYCRNIAGGSITGAALLAAGQCRVAIHWLGGWHHAKRLRASGYCYVNDCVLAILRLKQRFARVLYVDVDVHHGDGVEEAFEATAGVVTFSVHRFEAGFFPGTGAAADVGRGRGRAHAVNMPLREAAGDERFARYVGRALALVKERFRPDAICCQFGADGLNGDPMRAFNLTPAALDSVLRQLLSWKLPTLLLGGGGYHEANVARCWCRLTATVLGAELPDDVPELDGFFERYGPGFDFAVPASLRRDLNDEEYMEGLMEEIERNTASVLQL